MPEANEYPAPDSDESKAIEAIYGDERKARGAMIQRGWDYYNGVHDKPLKIQADGYDDNVIINDIEILAEKLETFLIGDGLIFDAGGDDQDTAADDQITALWKANQGEILQSNLALSGVIEGHIAVRLVPEEGQEWAKIQHIKQSHFAAFWEPFDMSRVVWYRLQSGNRRIDYVRGVVDGATVNHEAEGVWTELTYQGKMKQDALGPTEIEWVLMGSVFWEQDFAPITDWQNLPNPNSYYGKSDIKSAIPLNDNVNFIMSNLQRIIKYFAHPRTVGTGFTAADLISTAVSGLWTVESPEAKISNLEMTTDAALSRWLADIISQTLWQSGGVVDPQTIKDKVGVLTNFGLRVLFGDAIGRISKKRRLYGEGITEIIDHSFVLAGLAPPETVTIIWPDVLPEDAKTEMETLTAEFDRGLISKETYRDRRGYDDEQEENRLADEQTTGDLGSQILGNLSFNRGQ